MKCVKCGEELPLLSMVCPCCKTVFERNDIPGVLELTDAIDNVVINAQKAVVVEKSTQHSFAKPLYVAIGSIATAMSAVKSGSGLLWILTLILAISAVILFVKRKKEHDFAADELAFERGADLVGRYYKGNTEMNRFIQDSSQKLAAAGNSLKNAKARSIKSMIVISIIEIIVLGISVALIPSKDYPLIDKERIPDSYDEQVVYFINLSKPDAAIDTYVSSDYNNEFFGADKRKELCELLCKNGFSDDATVFFLNRCAGNAGDVECAKVIVKHYLISGEKDKANDFIKTCQGTLRYRTDEEKLRKLLN